MSLDITRLRLDSASQRVDRFIDNNIIQWVNEEITEQIKDSVRALGLSERVVNAITTEKTGFMKADVVFDLRGPNDEPLDEFLEKGFAPHDIVAKGKEQGGADALSWIDQFGTRKFAKRVRHPGFRGYNFMEQGERQFTPELTRRVEKETSEFMQKERFK